MVGENEALYATTELYRWGEKNHRCRLHIFYNAERAASDFDRLVRRLIACREKLLAGGAIEDINKNLQRYLIIRETPRRGLQVEFNSAFSATSAVKNRELGRDLSLYVFFVSVEHDILPGEYYTNFNVRWGIQRHLFSGESSI